MEVSFPVQPTFSTSLPRLRTYSRKRWSHRGFRLAGTTLLRPALSPMVSTTYGSDFPLMSAARRLLAPLRSICKTPSYRPLRNALLAGCGKKSSGFKTGFKNEKLIVDLWVYVVIQESLLKSRVVAIDGKWTCTACGGHA